MITSKTLRDVSVHCMLAPAPCIIAGGAPRDIDHGLYPKDIDIFCSVPNEEKRLEVIEFFTDEMFYQYIDDSEGEEYGENLNGILKVSNFNLDREQPVQIIFLDSNYLRDVEGDTFQQRVFNLFDLTICQIALLYDNESNKTKIYKSSSYKSDKISKHFTNTELDFARELTSNQRSVIKQRADRIGRKLGYMVSCFWNNTEEKLRADYRPERLERLRNLPLGYTRHTWVVNPQVANVPVHVDWDRVFNEGWINHGR